jgi:hypothetical protein
MLTGSLAVFGDALDLGRFGRALLWGVDRLETIRRTGAELAQPINKKVPKANPAQLRRLTFWVAPDDS